MNNSMNKFKKATKYKGIECTETHYTFRYLTEDVNANLLDGAVCLCGEMVYRSYYDCEKKQIIVKTEKRKLEE